MKITLEIKATGMELFDTHENVDPDEWTMIGWSEGFRAILTDLTNPSEPKRRAIEGIGLDEDSIPPLMDHIKNELLILFRDKYAGTLRDEFLADKTIQSRRDYALSQVAGNNKTG